MQCTTTIVLLLRYAKKLVYFIVLKFNVYPIRKNRFFCGSYPRVYVSPEIHHFLNQQQETINGSQMKTVLTYVKNTGEDAQRLTTDQQKHPPSIIQCAKLAANSKLDVQEALSQFMEDIFIQE